MYEFEVPASIKQNLSAYYRAYFWFREDDAQSIVHQGRKTIMVLFYICFVVSIGVGGQITADKDQRIFVSLMSVLASVHNYRIWLVLWKKKSILKCVDKIGIYYTKDPKKFDQLNNLLKLFMKFGDFFTIVINVGIVSVSFIYPILSRLSGKRGLFFSNAFVFDYSASDVSYLAVNVFVNMAMFQTAVVCSTIVPIVWYLLLSLVFRYRILRHQLKNLGKTFAMEDNSLSGNTQQKLFMKELLMAMHDYDKINRLVDEFASTFSVMFFLQTMTSAICLCGSIYNLAFSSHNNYPQDIGSCVILSFILFDIFMIMYLGNEIMLGSNDLSYYLFQSNWLDLTPSNKKCILILKERLKRPQELLVGKLYPLNLDTFTSKRHA
ncbi:odorant receptor 94a-like isoform X2 [Bradysia coprophila]|uniref:odorant receptor 94a-like isoform X2 n=1 Tax=Bradysia coprophila TaxID=38358 RepID=UPI00187DD6CE|nr:odorant receptor 94a-like isoform X2 [Bradysia coprophila]